MIRQQLNKAHSSMKTIYAFLIIFTIGQSQAHAQKEAYKFQIEGVADTVAYLANYYGSKLYYADTARVDNKGNFSFDAIPEDAQGKYAIVIPGPRYFEIIIADDEKIEIKTDTNNLVQNIEVIASKNNQIMYEYMGFLTERRAEREVLVKKIEANKDDEEKLAPLKEKYNSLNDRVIAYQKQIAVDNPKSFAAQEILMSVEPVPPLELEGDQMASYYYFKNHFFDNIKLKDDRLVRSPVFHTRLEKYLNTTLIKNPDSLIVGIDDLVAKLEPGSEMFKYVVHFTTYNYETSKIMGMDKVFVHLVDTYYKDDKAFWMDDEKLKAIKDKADSKRFTLIGMQAPELILQDSTGKWISTYRDLKQEYVVLYFFNPDCGHCKKETPKLVEYYNESDQDKVAIYTISSDNSQEWKDFISDYEMNFYNTSIPQEAFHDAEFATNLIRTGKTNYHSLKYQESFDVFSTPKVFILDKDRIIKAKDIGVEQLGEILDRLMEIDTTLQPEKE